MHSSPPVMHQGFEFKNKYNCIFDTWAQHYILITAHHLISRGTKMTLTHFIDAIWALLRLKWPPHRMFVRQLGYANVYRSQIWKICINGDKIIVSIMGPINSYEFPVPIAMWFDCWFFFLMMWLSHSILKFQDWVVHFVRIVCMHVVWFTDFMWQ